MDNQKYNFIRSKQLERLEEDAGLLTNEMPIIPEIQIDMPSIKQ